MRTATDCYWDVCTEEQAFPMSNCQTSSCQAHLSCSSRVGLHTYVTLKSRPPIWQVSRNPTPTFLTGRKSQCPRFLCMCTLPLSVMRRARSSPLKLTLVVSKEALSKISSCTHYCACSAKSREETRQYKIAISNRKI